MVAVALRWLIVVLLLLRLNKTSRRFDWRILRTRSLCLVLMWALGLSAFTGVFFVAAHHTSATNMGIITPILPGLVLVGVLVVYKTPTRLVQWVGAGVTNSGIAMVVSAGDLVRRRTVALNVGDLVERIRHGALRRSYVGIERSARGFTGWPVHRAGSRSNSYIGADGCR